MTQWINSDENILFKLKFTQVTVHYVSFNETDIHRLYGCNKVFVSDAKDWISAFKYHSTGAAKTLNFSEDLFPTCDQLVRVVETDEPLIVVDKIVDERDQIIWQRDQ